LNFFTTFSAVVPIAIYAPSLFSASHSLLSSSPLVNTIDICSTPPATMTSSSPALMALAQVAIACRLEAQNLFMVCAPTWSGRPALITRRRAGFLFSLFSCLVTPRITSPMSAGSSSGSLSRTPFNTCDVQSNGCVSTKEPFLALHTAERP